MTGAFAGVRGVAVSADGTAVSSRAGVEGTAGEVAGRVASISSEVVGIAADVDGTAISTSTGVDGAIAEVDGPVASISSKLVGTVAGCNLGRWDSWALCQSRRNLRASPISHGRGCK